MTFALTKFRAYSHAAYQPLNDIYEQVLEFQITAGTGDVAYDIFNTTGTFYTAVSGSTAGAAAIKTVAETLANGEAFVSLYSAELEQAKTQIPVVGVVLATTQYKKWGTVSASAGYLLYTGEGVTSAKIIAKVRLKQGCGTGVQYNITSP